MAYYVMVIEASFGEWQEMLRYPIEAQNRQMVKYHFHRTLKDWGFSDSQFGKHVLENWDAGVLKELDYIEEVDRKKYEVLKEYMYPWHKVNQH